MDAVAAEKCQIGGHVGAEETGRLLLVNDDVLRRWRDIGNDFVAVTIGFDRLRNVLAGTTVLSMTKSHRPSYRLDVRPWCK